MGLYNIKFIEQFKELNYPKNEMLIVGSAVMALFGLKENSDIDVWTTHNVFQQISHDPQFIKIKSKLDNSDVYQTKDYSIEIGSTLPPLEGNVIDYLNVATVVKGIYFQSLQDVLIWKRMVNRDKDKEDIEIIEKYLEGR